LVLLSNVTVFSDVQNLKASIPIVVVSAAAVVAAGIVTDVNPEFEKALIPIVAVCGGIVKVDRF
jgi:hypothetical protein